jgi:hypothetical protein
LKVKENVLEQAFPFLNLIKEIGEGSFVNLGVGEVGFQDSALFIRKDFVYHTSDSSRGKHKTFSQKQKGVAVIKLVCSEATPRFDIYGEILCPSRWYDRNFLF